MRKTNWKVIIFGFAPIFILLALIGFGGALGALLAMAILWVVTKIFRIDMNVYYDRKGNRITKGEYKKLKEKVDFGFKWLPKLRKK